MKKIYLVSIAYSITVWEYEVAQAGQNLVVISSSSIRKTRITRRQIVNQHLP
jgi:hypothetical protein